MNQSIEIEGKKYISSRRAAEITKYANDYVGQLCRQGKVKATRVGRQWYIDQDSILDHKKRSDEQLVQNGKNAANFSDSKFRNAETSPESAATKIEVKHEEEAIAQNVADAK